MEVYYINWLDNTVGIDYRLSGEPLSGDRYQFTDLISQGFDGDLGGVVDDVGSPLGTGMFLIGSYKLIGGEAEQIVDASWVDDQFRDRSFSRVSLAGSVIVPESNFSLGVLCGFFLLTWRLRASTRILAK